MTWLAGCAVLWLSHADSPSYTAGRERITMPPTSATSVQGASGAGTSLLLTKEELYKHTDVIAIDDKLYDVKAFAPQHPGGNLIRATGGTDCSALFRSMHPHSAEANLKALAPYQLGKLVAQNRGLPKVRLLPHPMPARGLPFPDVGLAVWCVMATV